MISYNPLKKILIDKNLKKSDLVKVNICSSATIAKLDKNLNISLDVVDKLCAYLDCQPGDLIEYVPDENKKANND